jgi:uncharacterized caspase-like protein
MKRVIILALFAGLAMTSSVLPARQDRSQSVRTNTSEPQLALVIGNAGYKGAPLANPLNDARDVAAALRACGFEVLTGEDRTQRQMKELIRQFGQKLRQGVVGVFYFAGHGIQANGRNYLIPIGATINAAAEIEYEAVEAGFVLAQMEEAHTRLNVVILDACRNNPYARGFRTDTRGLASVRNAPSGTLIAYATAADDVAADGGGRNGLYTGELLTNLKQPGLTLEKVFRRTRTNVRSKSGGKQVPYEYTSVEGEDFYFIAPASVTDNRAPKIFITEPSGNRAVGVKATNRLRVAGQVTDESGIRAITVNGTPVNFSAQGVFSTEVILQAQDRELVVTATDNAGLSASQTIQLNRDLVVANPSTTSTAPVFEDQFYALLIAVERYDHPSVKSLNRPLADAQRVGQILTTSYTFAPDRVALLANPSSEQVTDELDRLAKVLRPEDHLLIFYAGLGHWDGELGQGYWLPRDAQADKRSKWISNSTIRDYIKGIKTRHTLLISDACFSGGLLATRAAFDSAPRAIQGSETRATFDSAPPAIQQLARLKSRTAMTSGTLNEVPDKSVFVDYLIKRLQENREAFFSAASLFHSFREAVVNNSPVMAGGQPLQPQYGRIPEADHEGGDFIFVRKP